MSDAPGSGGGPVEPPEYKKYRARPRLLRRGGDAIADLRERLPARELDGAVPGAGGGPRRPHRRPPGIGRPRVGRPRWGRVVRWVLLAAIAWVGLAFLLFVVSAQIQSGKASDETKAALDDAGYPLVSPNNILVLGSDQRSEKTKEPGASTSGPSRSDSILLLRVGGGHSGRLSIARDTVVDIPGHGRGKINSAYAYGGAALAIQTIRQYLGVQVNHVIEVDFEKFPGLIDALGGITYRGGCVVSRINGGARNGGYTLRLRRGKSHLNGEQALALARTRKNDCARNENDLTRARRQQKVLAAMKDKVATPGGLFGIPHGSFYRLPLVGWRAPRAFTSDMGGLELTGVFAAMAVGGSAETQVLGTPSGSVPDALRDAAVRRFLDS
jgi:LCP family protein required for cell wall assembly